MNQSSMHRIASWSFVALALGAITGCSTFNRPATDQAQYLLDVPAPAVVADAAPQGSAIAVRRVTAVAPFDGLGFVYAQHDGTWRTDSYAGWIASPSSMVTNSLVSFLSSSKKFPFVGGQGENAGAPLGVSVVIERFCADYTKDTGARAVIRLRWYVTQLQGEKDGLLASGVALGDAPIASATPGAVADGFNAATALAFGEILAGISGVSAASAKE